MSSYCSFESTNSYLRTSSLKLTSKKSQSSLENSIALDNSSVCNYYFNVSINNYLFFVCFINNLRWLLLELLLWILVLGVIEELVQLLHIHLCKNRMTFIFYVISLLIIVS